MNKSEHILFHYIIRVSKKDSSFCYFQLEACDGLCFYSTTEESMGKGYRDIDIKGDKSLEAEFLIALESLKRSFPVEILEKHHLLDHSFS